VPEETVQAAVRWIQFTIGGERFALPVETVTQAVGLEELRPAGQAGWAGLLPLKGGLLPLANGNVLVGEAGAARGRGLVIRGRLPLGFTVDTVIGLTAGVACPLTSRVGVPELVTGALPTAEQTYLVLDAERLWQRLRASLEQVPGGTGYRLLPMPGLVRSAAPLQPTPAPVVPAPALVPSSVAIAPGPTDAPAVPTWPPVTPAPIGISAAPAEAAATPAIRSEAATAPEPSSTLVQTPATVSPVAASSLPAPVEAKPDPETNPVPHPSPASVDTAARARLGPNTVPFDGGAVLVFRVGLEADLAIPLEQVLEVGPVQQPRPIVGGPDHLLGLLTFRGRLVPLIDLPARLGRELVGPRQTLYLRLVGRAAQAVAVSVGEVAGQATVPALQPPGREYGVPASWVRGVARLGQRPLLILDPNALVAS
jgi:chemotaxis signal transduction protein